MENNNLWTQDNLNITIFCKEITPTIYLFRENILINGKMQLIEREMDIIDFNWLTIIETLKNRGIVTSNTIPFILQILFEDNILSHKDIAQINSFEVVIDIPNEIDWDVYCSNDDYLVRAVKQIYPNNFIKRNNYGGIDINCVWFKISDETPFDAYVIQNNPNIKYKVKLIKKIK